MARREAHLSRHRITDGMFRLLHTTPRKVLLTHVPQPAALDQQVPHTDGDQADITVRLNTSIQEVSMCEMYTARLKTGQCCLMATPSHMGV